MKQLNLCALIMFTLIGCATETRAIPIIDAVSATDKWNKQSVAMSGYLCVDLFTIYLASSPECDQIKEEQSGTFRIPLVLSHVDFVSASKITSGTRVVVNGVFNAPPPDAIRMTKGYLQGYYIEVSSFRRE